MRKVSQCLISVFRSINIECYWGLFQFAGFPLLLRHWDGGVEILYEYVISGQFYSISILFRFTTKFVLQWSASHTNNKHLMVFGVSVWNFFSIIIIVLLWLSIYGYEILKSTRYSIFHWWEGYHSVKGNLNRSLIFNRNLFCLFNTIYNCKFSIFNSSPLFLNLFVKCYYCTLWLLWNLVRYYYHTLDITLPKASNELIFSVTAVQIAF